MILRYVLIPSERMPAFRVLAFTELAGAKDLMRKCVRKAGRSFHFAFCDSNSRIDASHSFFPSDLNHKTLALTEALSWQLLLVEALLEFACVGPDEDALRRMRAQLAAAVGASFLILVDLPGAEGEMERVDAGDVVV